MKKKLLLIVLPIVFLICFSSTTEALTSEVQTGVTSGGLHTYMEWFKDYSGVLFVSSTFPNDSGIPYSDISVTAGCIDEEQIFRLRVYDSDEEAYIDTEKELSKGKATRKFYVEPSTDKNNLTWIAEATDESGHVVFARITLRFTYDGEIDYRHGISDKPPINWKKEKEQLVWRAIRWSLQILAGSICAVPLGVALARRFYGAG